MTMSWKQVGFGALKTPNTGDVQGEETKEMITKLTISHPEQSNEASLYPLSHLEHGE